jgi:hypothetical protein
LWLQSAITQSEAHTLPDAWERVGEDVLMRKKVRNRRARYAIGYGRPPTSSQFQPGQSGNPQGRPKGVRNASSMARDALERTINVKVKGAWRKMTVRKAAYRRLGDRAVAGDAKALDYLLSLESEEHPPGSDQAETERLAPMDLLILQDFFDRRRPSLPRHDDQQRGPGTKERGNK